MRLHHTLIDRLVRIYTTYGGYREETRLRDELARLDVSKYDRQTGEAILVATEEMDKQINPMP